MLSVKGVALVRIIGFGGRRAEHEYSMRDAWFVFLLVCGAVLLHGYHFGVEDHFVYLPAIRQALDPALYPHDSIYFQVQMRWMLFDELVAASVRASGLSLEWTAFLWHLLTIYLLLLGAWRVSGRVFRDVVARWVAVALLASLLILVAAGTLLYLADTYLGPRTLASALLLHAMAEVLDRRPRAALWLVVSFFIHPTMTLAGAWHLLFLIWRPPLALPKAAMLLWLPDNPAWREAVHLRRFIFPTRWPLVAQFAAVVPLLLLRRFQWMARKLGNESLEWVAGRLLFSGGLGIVLAVLLTTIPGREYFATAEPMRVIHFVFLVTVLLGGGLLGERMLGKRPLRWLLLFVPLCVGVFVGQRMLYPASPHLEWPWREPGNDWARAFAWVREHTPRDALFALNPHYTELPGQDDRGFRGLAARSALGDYSKDRMAAALAPELAPLWRQHWKALENWQQFTLEDFRRLKTNFGVNWVVLEQPGIAGLECPYQNAAVRVCRIP